jgi:hypothetical protein
MLHVNGRHSQDPHIQNLEDRGQVVSTNERADNFYGVCDKGGPAAAISFTIPCHVFGLDAQ